MRPSTRGRLVVSHRTGRAWDRRRVRRGRQPHPHRAAHGRAARRGVPATSKMRPAQPAGPAHDVLGAHASAAERRAATGTRTDEAARRSAQAARRRGDEDGDRAAAGRGVDLPRQRRTAAVSGRPAVQRHELVRRPRRAADHQASRAAVPDLPRIRECTSSIGGEATCFDFGDGNYLVGDAPTDGEGELGFCTSSGYYYVSGPSLEGGVGAACPGDPAVRTQRRGDAPTARECTSSIGGDATCFDFGGGNYIVSDPIADGEGELGFCTDSRLLLRFRAVGARVTPAPSARSPRGRALARDAYAGTGRRRPRRRSARGSGARRRRRRRSRARSRPRRSARRRRRRP